MLQYPSPFQTLSRRPFPPCAATPQHERTERVDGEEEKENQGTLSSILAVPLQKPVEIPLLFPFSPSPWFSSLFMVVPPCVVQLGGSRRITVTLAAKQTVGNRCWDRRRRRCLCCLQGKTLGETCSCCRTCFPSGFRGFQHMGEVVVVAAWNRIKVLPRHYTQHIINLSSFSSWQFFVVLMITKKYQIFM